ncbi:MAG TPA: hypothetical protein DD624_03100 [Alphaproteobacteria bacterium]|nr:hypothetical protein [Alphaproteobacteria bacterium]
MAGSVSEFLSKGNVQKFKNGIKSAFGRNLPKTLVASAVLAGAFAACSKQSAPESDAVKPRTTYAVKENGDTLCAYQAIPMSDADYARLQKLVNAATKTESGCEILKGIAKAGTTLRIDYSGEDNLGYFQPEDNSICLGRQCGDADLQSVLIHEGEHALQNQRVPQRTSRYNFESNLKSIRVTEADAMTMQTLFSFEMAEQGDSAALKMMTIRHKGMVDTYAKAAEKYGKGSAQALKETMLSWYDDKNYVKTYDEDMAVGHAEKVDEALGVSLLSHFSKTADADALLANACQYKGVKYAGTDGSILNTPRTAWLNVETRDKMSKVHNRLVSKTLGFNGDESVDNFYMRKDGKVSKQTYKQIVATMVARQKYQGR